MASLVQREFTGAVDELSYMVNKWSNVSKTTKSVNTYNCSKLIPRKKITLEDIDWRLGGVSATKSNHEAITDTGAIY